MKSHQCLLEEFRSYCRTQKEYLIKAGQDFRDNGDEWEYVKTKIKAGIADLVLVTSVQIHNFAVETGPTPEWLRKAVPIETLHDHNERFYSFFLAFLEHVSLPWVQSHDEGKKRNDTELIEKETIKLEYIHQLCERFIALHADVQGGNDAQQNSPAL